MKTSFYKMLFLALFICIEPNTKNAIKLQEKKYGKNMWERN